MQKEQIPKYIIIDCPLCNSGNGFRFEQVDKELVCDDCGFVLAVSLEKEVLVSGICIFCGSKHFFIDYPFTLSFLSFLGYSSVCYVCEAEYKDIKIKNSDERYNEEFANRLQNTEAAKNWKKRMEAYYQS